MRRSPIIIAVILAFAISGNGAAQPSRADQARANLEMLRAGQKSPGQFTPQELTDMRAFEAALRQNSDQRSPSQRCIDREVARADGAPTTLELRVIDLKCRPVGEP